MKLKSIIPAIAMLIIFQTVFGKDYKNTKLPIAEDRNIDTVSICDVGQHGQKPLSNQ